VHDVLFQVLSWSAETEDDFYRGDRYIVGGGGSGKTYHTVFDAVTGTSKGLLVSNTKHDMFCPGITMLPTGVPTNAISPSCFQCAHSAAVEACIALTGYCIVDSRSRTFAGDIIVTGGQNANKTSIYQLATNQWVPAADMSISRGYGSSCLLSNGKV
jgi:galactose oxidase